MNSGLFEAAAFADVAVYLQDLVLASLPLALDDAGRGALSLYSDQPAAFDPQGIAAARAFVV